MWSVKRQIGNKGEDEACTYLQAKGYSLIERNYLRKWGEIDIVAQKQGILHFIEVKTATNKLYRPEEHVDYRKIQRLRRVIESYLVEHQKIRNEWIVDVISVVFDKEGKPMVEMLENIIL